MYMPLSHYFVNVQLFEMTGRCQSFQCCSPQSNDNSRVVSGALTVGLAVCRCVCESRLVDIVTDALTVSQSATHRVNNSDACCVAAGTCMSMHVGSALMAIMSAKKTLRQTGRRGLWVKTFASAMRHESGHALCAATPYRLRAVQMLI